MDMREFNKYGVMGISQYDLPQNYELAGKKFEFAMDDGIDYTLNFIDKTTLEWNFAGEQPSKASGYLCGKGDDTTYLVSYELAGAAKRSNHTWVIDLENQLVTRIVAVVGDNPRYEYLITPKYTFGAIKREGEEVKPYPRHGFTDDITGNIVQWTYGAEMATVHVYYCSDFYRITYPPERASSQVFNEAMAKLPSSDEPTAYIKIKDGIDLFSLTEANMEKVLGGAMPFRSNTMAFLQNYKRVYQIGRAFGTTMFEDRLEQLHISFGAYGKILEPKEEYILKMLTDPNPFIV
jgi:hypothetical protein